MMPVVSIVGRPNVGKSTLFNELTKRRNALVADLPGVTRDRQYGDAKVGDHAFIVIDTGGLGADQDTVDSAVEMQSWRAIEEADVVLFLVDAQAGLTTLDEEIAKALRLKNKKLYLVANKTDGLDPNIAIADFHAVGLGAPIPISASRSRGIVQLVEKISVHFPQQEEIAEADPEHDGIRIGIVGRPNVGKSTLVNRMLGDDRVVVFDKPGTTRDSIYIELERLGKHYTLIDTAGVRRRAKVFEAVEKFSVVKTLKAIKDSHVVILVLDAREGITDQDLGLLGYILESGRALVLAINKWDGLDPEQRTRVKTETNFKLNFALFAKVHFISAMHGTGVGNLFGSVHRAYHSATKRVATSRLTRILEEAMEQHQPPMIRGRRIKLRYAHAGGHLPPLIVIHGNQTAKIPDSYTRYLMNLFRKALKLEGTPVRIEYKTSDNPYAGRRNKLTPRQEYKRKRMMKFIRKK